MIDVKDLSKNLDEILNYKPSDAPVISLYLGVDAARITKQEYTTVLNSIMTSKKAELEASNVYQSSQKKSIYEMMEAIKLYINDYFRPESAKALLVFAKEGKILAMVRLPFNLKSKIIIDPKPHTQILRAILGSITKYGILVIDREKAQIILMSMGEIKQYLDAFISDVPPKVNYRSQLALREKSILSRFEEKLHHFFKIINEKTLIHLREGKFDHIILAGKKEIVSQFSNYLHSFIAQKYIGSIAAEPADLPHIIRDSAKELIDRYELGLKNKIVGQLIDNYRPQELGVLGVQATIGALMLEQVRTLIYNNEFSAPGYVCSECGYITLDKAETCPYCSNTLTFYNDITDEIVETAIKQGCEIVDAQKNERLAENGNIGAILRFKIEAV
jgi:peptide chain release factor subunit 1